MTLAVWVLAALLHFAPISRLPHFEGYEETPEAALLRYAAIADDITAAVEDGEPSGLSDRDEAALLAAIAIGETHLALDTDRGPCFRGGAFRARCDRGKAESVWQVHRWSFEGRVPKQGELFGDRRLAARMALYSARWSLRLCRKLPALDRLSALSGHCQEGLESARDRYRLWLRVRAWKPKAEPSS